MPIICRLLLLGCVLILLAIPGVAGSELISQEQTQPTPAGGGGSSAVAAVSPDGRYIAYLSDAPNLVSPVDHRAGLNLYLLDRDTGETKVVTRRRDGRLSTEPTWSAQFSQGERFLIFESSAKGLTDLPVSGAGDVYRYNLEAGGLELVSINLSGLTGGNRASYTASASADGSRVVFLSKADDLVAKDGNDSQDIFVRDLGEQVTYLVTMNGRGDDSAIVRTGVIGSESPIFPSISADGRYVAFAWSAEDIAMEPPPSEWNSLEIYLRDLDLQVSSWLTRSTWEAPTRGDRGDSFHPVVDGGFVYFLSYAGDLMGGTYGETSNPNLYRIGLAGDNLTHITYDPDGTVQGVDEFQIGPNGNWVAYTSIEDSNQQQRLVRLWEAVDQPAPILALNATNGPVSVPPDSFHLSEDQRFFTYLSESAVLQPDLPSPGFQLYQRDLSLGTTRLLSSPPAGDSSSSVCTDFEIDVAGQVVAFDASDGNLVENDRNGYQDVLLWDAGTASLTIVSTADSNQVQSTSVGSSGMSASALSQDGRYVAFASMAEEWVPGDTNGFSDVFLRDRLTETTMAISVTPEGWTGNGGSWGPVMSADTRYVAFLSYANDLSAGDTNYLADLYLRDLSTGITSLISVNEAGHSVGVDLDQNPLFSPDGQWVGALSEESRFSLEDRTFIARNLWTGTRQEYSLKADDFYAKIAPLALSSSGAVLYADLRYAGSVKLFSVEPEALEPATWTNRISAPFATTLGGEYLAYYSGGSQGASLQLLELATQELTELYPETPFQLWGGVRRLILSADGSSVVLTTSQQLAPEDNNEFGDVYRLKRDAPGVAELVSVTPAGFSGNGSSGNPTVSADGRFIAFRSFASDLVGGDDNESLDVFLRDCEAGRTWLISASEQTTQTGRGMSNGARLSADGQVLLFGSTAGDLAEGDFNRNVDLLIWELPSPPVGDLDLDFMDDDWELIHFGGFHRDGSLDADGDGLTDWVEFQVATRPGDVTSVWRLELTVVVGQVNELTWSGTADQHYGLHYTDEPVNPEWLPLPGSPFAVESGLMQQIDDSPPSVGARYYRVVLLE